MNTTDHNFGIATTWPSLKFAMWIVCCLSITLLRVNDGRADLVYEFSSGSYVIGPSPHSAGDSITGYFIISGNPSFPLNAFPASFEFTFNDSDGASSFSRSADTFSFGSVSIDGLGVVTDWNFDFFDDDTDGDGSGDLDKFILSPISAAAITADPDDLNDLVSGAEGIYGAGSWTLVVPEVSAFVLVGFCLGLVSLGSRTQRGRDSHDEDSALSG